MRAGAYWGMPPWGRVAATFVLVLITWVFFRSSDVAAAMPYLRDMSGFGIGPSGRGADRRESSTSPITFGTFCLAALITWGAPQTWDWTRVMTPVKAAAVVALLVLSAVMLTTQAYNPFIYFIF